MILMKASIKVRKFFFILISHIVYSLCLGCGRPPKSKTRWKDIFRCCWSWSLWVCNTVSRISPRHYVQRGAPLRNIHWHGRPLRPQAPRMLLQVRLRAPAKQVLPRIRPKNGPPHDQPNGKQTRPHHRAIALPDRRFLHPTVHPHKGQSDIVP